MSVRVTVNRSLRGMNVHGCAQQLQLQRHDRLANPDDREHARKDQAGLVFLRLHGQEHAQEQAKDQRTPRYNHSVSPHISSPQNIPSKPTYQRSQSLNPSLMPPCSTTSASGHRPTNPLNRPPNPSLPNPLDSPRSAVPPIPPPPLVSIPPSRYFGYSTWRIFSHTANRSRDSVCQTVSSMVFCGARRSSPGIEDVR